MKKLKLKLKFKTVNNNRDICFIVLISILIIICIFVYLLSSFPIIRESFMNKNKLSDNLDVYCINLDKNTDRWNRIQEAMKRNTIEIKRFSAHHGKQLNVQDLIDSGIVDTYHELDAGQLGCAYSHISVMKRIKNGDAQYGLILEDDVILPDNFKSIIDNLKLPDTDTDKDTDRWDIIFLGGCNIKGSLYNKHFIKPTDYTGTYNLCCHAMLFNKDTIDNVLDCLTPLKYPIDNQLRNNFDTKLVVYYANPNIINQNKDLISVRRVIDGKPQSDYWKKNHTNIEII